MNNVLNRLKKSKFRSSFKLSKMDLDYIDSKGMLTIRKHACEFINNRIASSNIANDGKQTPMRGHPVFIAQHATATCCRGCLQKWHHIAKNHELSVREKEYIVDIIMKWIENEYNAFK